MSPKPSLPSLRTARLHLYPAGLEDLEARVAMDRDPRVMRYIRAIPEDTEAQRIDLRERIQGPAGTFWHVEMRAEREFLGWCGLIPLEDSGLIEIGYRFIVSAWGRGIATEAALAVLDHGFRVLEIDPIVAVAHLENRASQGVLGKLGLRLEGTAFHYGQDLAFFRLSRGGYLAGLGGG